MKKFALSAALLVVAVNLAACSGQTEAPVAVPISPVASPTGGEAAPTAKPVPAVPKPSPDPDQAWADDMINLFLNGNSKSTFDEFNPILAHHFIKSWGQESKGVLSIIVSGDKWTKCDLDTLGMTFIDTAGWKNPDMKLVKVASENGKTISRTDHDSNKKSAVPASCL